MNHKPNRMTAVKKGDGYYEDVYYTNGRTLSSGVVYLNEKGDFTNAAIQKLGEIEDVEEGLGIDLVTFLKALKNGIYVKDPIISYIEGKLLSFQEDCFVTGYDFDTSNVYWLEDYGKTWALTKEELK